MIGTSAELLLPISIKELNTPDGFLGYMHGGAQGYLYHVLRNHEDKYGNKRNCMQRAYSVSEIIARPDLFFGVHSSYCSMNTFWREIKQSPYKGRTRDKLKRLRACYVDLDYYDKGLSREEVLQKVHMMIKAGILPKPTMINSSGMGLYLIYKLRDEDARAVSRWSAFQHYLVETLADLGADAHCTDPSRVLRVPGSINAKNGGVVEVLEFEDIVYTVYELYKNYGIKYVQKISVKKPAQKKKSDENEDRVVYPYGHATEKQRSYVRGLAKRLNIPESEYPDFTNFKATDAWIKAHKDMKRPVKAPSYKTDFGYDLPEFISIRDRLRGYCEDIETLLLMRSPVKGANGKSGCKREIGLFLIRLFLKEIGYTKEQALKKILEINARLSCPLDTDEVIKATASAVTHYYIYPRAKIIGVLGIDAEELKELPHLGQRSQTSKEYRKYANRRYYESRLETEGKKTKKDAIQERQAEIICLQEQGLSAAEIREKLNISKATYHRDIAAINAQKGVEAIKEEVKETVEQVANVAQNTKKAATRTVQKTVKKIGLRAAICAAQQRERMREFWVSHFFSSPFEIMNCEAVLLCSNLQEKYNIRLNNLGIIRTGDRGDGEDPDADSSTWDISLSKKIK